MKMLKELQDRRDFISLNTLQAINNYIQGIPSIMSATFSLGYLICLSFKCFKKKNSVMRDILHFLISRRHSKKFQLPRPLLPTPLAGTTATPAGQGWALDTPTHTHTHTHRRRQCTTITQHTALRLIKLGASNSV